MAKHLIKTVQLLKNSALGLSLSFMFVPIAIPVPVQAQSNRPVQTQQEREEPQPRPESSSPSTTLSSEDREEYTRDTAGSCSGVNDCNNFIAICIGGGGEYVPKSHNGQGQPTSGSCRT